MKNLIEKINESLLNESVFVAIEDIAEPDYYHDKRRISYRVVSLETFQKLINGEGRSYGEHEYHEIGRAHSRDEAESFLPQKKTGPRKSSIDKEGADYIVYTINIGKVSPTTGKTKFDWSIFDDEHKDSEIYIIGRNEKTNWFSVLWGSENSLKKGDTVIIVDNDSQRKTGGVASGKQIVIDSCKSTKAEFDKFAKKYDYFTREAWSYRKQSKWGRLNSWYSIKGVSE